MTSRPEAINGLLEGPSSNAAATDPFGRRFEYLRLSVLDACNFRCVYCLPNGFAKTPGAEAPLSLEEIRRLVTGFVALGTWKIRLTGGEPTLRKDIVDVASTVARVAGVRQVALSTNGYRLAALARPLAAAGVTKVNVSVDSLDPAEFARITGQDRLADVLAGVEAALALGMHVKLNCVLMRGLNERALDEFSAFVETRPATVCFIQLMRTGDNADFFAAHHLAFDEVRDALLARGFAPRARLPGDGPAEEFS